MTTRLLLTAILALGALAAYGQHIQRQEARLEGVRL